MATPYSQVYEFFLMKVDDYSFADITQKELEDDLDIYLRISTSKFTQCKIDLSDRDDTLRQFNQTLKDIEAEIIATLMVIEYLKPKITSTQIIHQSLTDKDIRMHSQAIHLREMQNLYRMMTKESDLLINRYTYNAGNLDDLNE